MPTSYSDAESAYNKVPDDLKFRIRAWLREIGETRANKNKPIHSRQQAKYILKKTPFGAQWSKLTGKLAPQSLGILIRNLFADELKWSAQAITDDPPGRSYYKYYYQSGISRF